MNYQDLLKLHPELFTSADESPLRIITDPKIISSWQDNYRSELAAKGQAFELADLGVLISDQYITLVRDLVKFPDGEIHGYNRLINTANLAGGQGVAVIPIYHNKILLIYLFRHPTRQWHYEVPRGFGEPNVPAAENARKEVLEEVEGQVAELVDLGEIYNNSGLEANATRLFLARLSDAGKPNEAEGIKSIKWVTTNELEEMIRTGEITDSFTICAYTRARLNGLL